MTDIQQLKRLSIRDYLSRRGIQPSRGNDRCGFYLSPLRMEHTPSFKVDYAQNLWYDFGTGEGGSIIDLVMRLENCDCPEAIRRLQDGETGQGIPVSLSPGIYEHPVVSGTSPVVRPATVPALRILSDAPLRHPALVGYLASRGIAPVIATAFCREVRYEVGGRIFFAVGFRNDAGGWELRSEHFKGGSSPKHITTIDNGSDTVIAFEGFMDFLSYLTLKQPEQLRINAAVLNSVINLPKAMPFLQRHQTVHTFFDNDEAGRQATAQVQQLPPAVEVVDQAPFYRSHDDLNNYLQARQPRIRQGARQQPPRTISKAPNPGPKQRR
ncbi:MAG: toprim domain-containing protein [Alistipes sp.]|jgi:DNA primase (bacterial type)|uniref:toprim domain-containing protein n=1 Tax=Alistipes TaxID=239759 RepID=UPI001D39B11E|nr:toprim domain-containing protein [Alistipes sp.]MBS6100091.1 toprim domain-containing protein [Alistipes sp.]HJI19304.1 toprim domain-containing protein [Rikenellaceae bacterium]